MPSWAITLIVLGAGIVASYWGWAGIQIVRLGRDVARLRQDVESQHDRCNERLEWMRDLDAKLDDHGTKLTRVLTILEQPGDHPRVQT